MTESFRQLIMERLLPEFCNDPKRNYGLSGFREASLLMANTDTDDFIRAWNAELISHVGNGIYQAPMSFGGEQFFWESKRTEGADRAVSLWKEPIIAVGVLARLHFDYGWPKEFLGTQSPDWAFDIVAYQNSEKTSEHIACEVKKTVSEMSRLVNLMMDFGQSHLSVAPPKAGPERNAYKKVIGLLTRKAPIFWAVGPDHESMIFKVEYHADGRITLNSTHEDALRYSFA